MFEINKYIIIHCDESEFRRNEMSFLFLFFLTVDNEDRREEAISYAM